jgi:hypothetical protein
MGDSGGDGAEERRVRIDLKVSVRVRSQMNSSGCPLISSSDTSAADIVTKGHRRFWKWVLVFIFAIAGYGWHRIAGIPNVEEPSDVVGFASISVAPQDNELNQYRQAKDAFVASSEFAKADRSDASPRVSTRRRKMAGSMRTRTSAIGWTGTTRRSNSGRRAPQSRMHSKLHRLTSRSKRSWSSWVGRAILADCCGWKPLV